MFKRSTCAAAVAAAFSLAAIPAAMAQTAQDHARTVRPAQAGQQNHQGRHYNLQRNATQAAPASRAATKPAAPHHAAARMVTAANMPTAIDTLTSDVVVLPTYHAQRNASQLTPF